MQEHALKSLESLRNVGEEKGLIISATGTGKTILCALDVRAYSPDKFLFIVHNEGILNRAIEEFKKVFPYEDESNFGLLTGKRKDHDAKFLLQQFKHFLKRKIINCLTLIILTISFLTRRIELLHLVIRKYLIILNLTFARNDCNTRKN